MHVLSVRACVPACVFLNERSSCYYVAAPSTTSALIGVSRTAAVAARLGPVFRLLLKFDIVYCCNGKRLTCFNLRNSQSYSSELPVPDYNVTDSCYTEFARVTQNTR